MQIANNRYQIVIGYSDGQHIEARYHPNERAITVN